jgi:hypothetical protein
MAKTVADQFAEILVAAGVKRIYGIVGRASRRPSAPTEVPRQPS